MTEQEAERAEDHAKALAEDGVVSEKAIREALELSIEDQRKMSEAAARVRNGGDSVSGSVSHETIGLKPNSKRAQAARTEQQPPTDNFKDKAETILWLHNGELGVTWEDPDVVTPDTLEALTQAHQAAIEELIGEDERPEYIDGKVFDNEERNQLRAEMRRKAGL